MTHEREGTNSFGNLRFYTKENANPATMLERMRISKEGKVGINSTAPQALLDIEGTGTIAKFGSSDSTYETLFIRNNTCLLYTSDAADEP